MILNVRCKVSLNPSLTLICKKVSSLTPLPSSVPSNPVTRSSFTTAHSDCVGDSRASLRGLHFQSQAPHSQLFNKNRPFCQLPTIFVPVRKRTSSALSGGRTMPPPLAAVLPGGGRVLSIQSHTVSVRRQPHPDELLIHYGIDSVESTVAVPFQSF